MSLKAWSIPDRSSYDRLPVHVRALLTRMIEHDTTTYQHLIGVGNVASAISTALGCNAVETRGVLIAAVLHDIGKIHIPTAILQAPRALTESEWRTMRDHPVTGEFLARSLRDRDVCGAIRHHHERLDGTGYPDGLKGSAIPSAARIIAVADAYDVLVGGRPYAAALSPFQAIERIIDCSGTHFDPEVVSALVAIPASVLARPA